VPFRAGLGPAVCRDDSLALATPPLPPVPDERFELLLLPVPPLLVPVDPLVVSVPPDPASSVDGVGSVETGLLGFLAVGLGAAVTEAAKERNERKLK
jgi:hypothetical protein